MDEFLLRMLNNKWVLTIGTVILMMVFIVIPEIKAEIERMKNGRRPIPKRDEQ